jgi:hypothetical protein
MLQTTSTGYMETNFSAFGLLLSLRIQMLSEVDREDETKPNALEARSEGPKF